MNSTELYRQKSQARLDEHKADLAKMRALAAGAKADVGLAINKEVDALAHGVEEAQRKIAALAEDSKDAAGSFGSDVESALASLKSALVDAGAKFRG